MVEAQSVMREKARASFIVNGVVEAQVGMREKARASFGVKREM